MKRYAVGVLFFLFLSSLLAQQTLIENSIVINVEVPVRVFKEGKFVDNLSLDDFEVYEDGIAQRIEAVYLVKKDIVERRDERKKFKPETERTFFLFFEVSEYDPRLGEAVDYFARDILLPGDSLIAVTPIKTYRLKDRGLERKSREAIAEELKSLIRKDSIAGGSAYRSAVKDLTDFTKFVSAALASEAGLENDATIKLDGQGAGLFNGLEEMGIDVMLDFYSGYVKKLNVLRQVEELKLMDFAKYLKLRKGQNYVFLFYQREYIPQIDPKIWTQVSTSVQNAEGTNLSLYMAEIMDFFNQDQSINIERVKRAYADASTSVHFLYITRPAPNIPGVYFAERSNDVFAPFSEMARASGGFMDSSSNPEYLLRRAVEESENYYLLYYAPKDYAGDGEFKTIDVKIRGKGFRTVHRMGYYSN